MREYIEAAMIKIKIDTETRPVCFNTFQKRDHDSLRFTKATKMAAAAPAAPASVGVKKPE